MNGASVQPSEGQQHGMKIKVLAEQMKVCMLKSLLLLASSSFKSHIILMGWGKGGKSPAAKLQHRTALAPLLPVRLSLRLRRCAPAPVASLQPRALRAPRPSRNLLSVSPARGSSGARDRGGDSPSPANTAVPGPRLPGGRGEAGCPIVTAPRKILLKQHFKWQHNS